MSGGSRSRTEGDRLQRADQSSSSQNTFFVCDFSCLKKSRSPEHSSLKYFSFPDTFLRGRIATATRSRWSAWNTSIIVASENLLVSHRSERSLAFSINLARSQD